MEWSSISLLSVNENGQRGIALATSKDLGKSPVSFVLKSRFLLYLAASRMHSIDN